MHRTVLEFQRRFLLGTSLLYGFLATAVPTTLVTHAHLAPSFGLAAATSGLLLMAAVLRVRELGTHRGLLASGLLLAGPLGPLWLARSTRRWKPLLMVRPGTTRR